MTYSRAITNSNLGGRSGEAGSDQLLLPAAYTPYRALEARIVFDAAGAATAVEVAQDAPDAPEGDAGAVPDSSAGSFQDLVAALSSGGPVELPGQTGEGAEAGGVQIVFIDGAVNDPGVLAGAIPAGAEIVMLDRGSDGLTQIATYLDGRTGIDALHIISHGGAGELNLGNAVVDSNSISGSHADEIAIIRSALSEHGDIALYGCNVAAGSDGLAFLEALSNATGADIAASSDDTGTATLGGNWDLETRLGLIEAGLIDAPEWNGLLAPLTISTTLQPAVTGATGTNAITGLLEGGVGYTALWTNAGTIGSTLIDVRATVTSLTASTVSYFTQGDDLSIILNGGATATIKWEIFAADATHSLTIYAVGSPNFRIADIDGVGGLPNTREIVRPQLNGLTGYTVDTPTNLVAAVSASGVQVSGTQNQNGEATSLTAFTWQDVSTWQVEYTLVGTSGFANAVFRHDGDGDFTFVAPNTVNLLSLDLDANNSAASGTSYQATYTENGAGILIADLGDVAIAQNAAIGTTLGSASIVLTNAQTGDVLTAGTLPAGISASVDTSVPGKITVTLTGAATIADYQNALQAIAFSSTSENPSATDRQIEVSVKNTTFGTTSNVALSTIHVLAVNDEPSGADATISTAEDTPHTFTAANFGFSDPIEANTLQSVTIQPLTGGGTLTFNGVPVTAATIISAAQIGLLVYTPAADANGAGLASFTFQVTDNGGTANGGQNTDQSPNTITFNVSVVNDPPVDGNETNNVTEDTTLTVLDGAAGDLLNNATDVDGDTLTITGYTIAGVAGSHAAGSGVLISGIGTITINANGSYSFAPLADYTGAIPVITYTVSDGNGGTDASTLALSMVAVNDAPVDGDETNSVTEDITLTVADGATGDLLNNATDVDGDTLTITGYTIAGISGTQTVGSGVLISGVGTITINANGSYSFAPVADYTGAIPVITYTVSDGNGGTDTSTLTLAMVPVNDAPAGTPANQTSADGQTVSIDVGAAFTDVDSADIDYAISGLPAGLTYDPETGVISGTLGPNVSQGGTGGVYTITVDATDGTTTTSRTFTFTVTNPVPVAVNDSGTTNENAAQLLGNVKTNDHDGGLDSDTLTVTAGLNSSGGALTIGSEVTLPSGAKLTLNADGTYTYKPNGAFESLDLDESTTDTFTYTISDGQGGTATATVTITIDGRNDAPQAGTLPNITGQDGDTVSLNLGALFTDPDIEPLAFTISGLPAGLTYNPATGLVTGQIDFRASQNGLFPAPGGGTIYLIQVSVSDGDAEITRTFQYKVTNPAPVAVADSNYGQRGRPGGHWQHSAERPRWRERWRYIDARFRS